MRFRLLRAVPVLLAASLLTLLTACSRRQTRVEAGNAAGILHVAISAEPQTLDPHLAVAFNDMQVILAFFEGLTAIDETTSRAVPAAAESWSVSDDGLQWTFILRPDLKWSDGTPLTAQTFRDSFARALAPTIASEYAYILAPIKNATRFNAGEIPDFVGVGVKVVDERTLRFTLEHPTPAFASILSLPVAFPVPLHLLRTQGGTIDRHNRWTRPQVIVGNGPLKVTAWQPNQQITGDRNPFFRDAAHVSLNGVAFYPYENAASQEAAFRAGQLHLTSQVPLTKIVTYRADAPAQLRLDAFLQSCFIRFNLSRPPLHDVRVRRALALAIDRQALADHVLTGGQQPAFSLSPPHTAGYTAAPGVSYDPEAARALLADAGFPGGIGLRSLEIMSRPSEIDRQVLEALQQMWRHELGVDVAIALKESRVWLEDEHSLNYDLSNGAWIGDYVDAETFLALFRSDSGNNSTTWANPTYDALLAQASRTQDETARHALYGQAESLLLSESPVTPLYYGTQPFLIRPEVQGWPVSLLGFHRFQNVRLIR